MDDYHFRYIRRTYFLPAAVAGLADIRPEHYLQLYQNLTTPLQWTMFSDVVDYEEHRSGRRLDGLVFSTALFAIKFGLALGGAVVGWVLGMVDYAPGQAVQAPHVLSTINALFTLIPCALFI
ncbi:MFS transporter, partial [Enterobacter soli]